MEAVPFVWGRSDGTGKVAINLNDVIARAVAMTRNEWNGLANLTTQLDATLPLVACFPGSIIALVVHLLINAAHAVSETAVRVGTPGWIKIATREDGKLVEIRVTDSANRLDPTLRHPLQLKEGGEALVRAGHPWLAVAHATVVQQHQGQLDIAPGPEGASFIIRLPATGS
jgi:signal transduction histidine kinase